jgi:hypothetical protein
MCIFIFLNTCKHTHRLALYCFDYLENIGFIYPAMSMIIIGHSLLY